MAAAAASSDSIDTARREVGADVVDDDDVHVELVAHRMYFLLTLQTSFLSIAADLAVERRLTLTLPGAGFKPNASPERRTKANVTSDSTSNVMVGVELLPILLLPAGIVAASKMIDAYLQI